MLRAELRKARWKATQPSAFVLDVLEVVLRGVGARHGELRGLVGRQAGAGEGAPDAVVVLAHLRGEEVRLGDEDRAQPGASHELGVLLLGLLVAQDAQEYRGRLALWGLTRLGFSVNSSRQVKTYLRCQTGRSRTPMTRGTRPSSREDWKPLCQRWATLGKDRSANES